MILWVGAGLGGLIVLVTSSLDAGAPRIFNGLIASLVVVSGGSLALSRVGFEWAGTTLDREMQDKHLAGNEDLPSDFAAWPRNKEFFWYLGLLTAMLAGVVYLCAVWYAVAGGSREADTDQPPTVTVTAPRGPTGRSGPTGPSGRRGPRGRPGPAGPRDEP
jgi:hypothetical protein